MSQSTHTVPVPGLHLTRLASRGAGWEAGLGRFRTRGGSAAQAKAAMGDQLAAAAASSTAEPGFGLLADGTLVVAVPRPWGTDFYEVSSDGYQLTSTTAAGPDGGCPLPDGAAPLAPLRPRGPGRRAHRPQRPTDGTAPCEDAGLTAEEPPLGALPDQNGEPLLHAHLVFASQVPAGERTRLRHLVANFLRRGLN